MSDEVDPNWPPPRPEARSQNEWIPPEGNRPGAIDPNWAPPTPLARAGALAPSTAVSSPPQPPPRAVIGDRKLLVWSLSALAGVGCVALGAVITLALANTQRTAQTVPPDPVPPSRAEPSAPAVAPSSPASPATPPPAVSLVPNQFGYVTMRTASGKTKCQISADKVICEAQYTNSPIIDGDHADGAVISPDGGLKWLNGNLGNAPEIRLGYQIYHALGWTVSAAENGTTFTNDRTGRGAFVSVDDVHPT